MSTLRAVSPNQPATPISGFRIPVELKAAAAAKAKAEGKTLTDVVIECLREYASRD